MPITKTSFKKGHIVTEEMRKKISIATMGNIRALGYKASDETKEKLRKLHLGKPLAQEVKDKIVKTMKLKGIKPALHYVAYGSDNKSWKGGVSKFNKTERQLLMEKPEYIQWRKQIFERDDYVCQICFIKGNRLNADHIKSWAEFPELRYKLNNGRTLCENCHRQTDTYGNRNKLYGLNTRYAPEVSFERSPMAAATPLKTAINPKTVTK